MRHARGAGEYPAPHINRELTRASLAEQAVEERLAHTPDIYFLDNTQFTTCADTEIVGYLRALMCSHCARTIAPSLVFLFRRLLFRPATA